MTSSVFFLRLTLGISTRGTIMRFCFWGFFSLFPETVYVHSHLILLDLWGPFIPALPALPAGPPSLLLDTFVSLGHDVTLFSCLSHCFAGGSFPGPILSLNL